MVEYKHFLIPVPRSFVPRIETMSAFVINASKVWLGDPGWIAKMKDKKMSREPISQTRLPEVLNEFKNCDIRMAFPLAAHVMRRDISLEIHLAGDYICHLSETMEWPLITSCKCGHELDYYPDADIFLARRILSSCPRCGNFFDPSEIPAIYTDGWTGNQTILNGGATYRFALVLICGRAQPEDQNFNLDTDFKKLCAEFFDSKFVEVPDIS